MYIGFQNIFYPQKLFTHMKKTTQIFAAFFLLSVSFTACTKEVKETEDEISAETLAKIENLGFSTYEAKKIPEGYLVEGDIILTEENLINPSRTPSLIFAQEEQYRTTNLVSRAKHDRIQIALDNSSSNHQNVFTAALEEAVRRYNNDVGTGYTLYFDIVSKSQSPDITIVAYYENSNVLGSAGFPTSAGDPYNQVRMNTYHYGTGTDLTNVNYIATIIAHEIGHCIGMRHTDYMDRSFSCGGRKQNEEKPFSSGYGAIHIPGTPTSADNASWMLACVSRGTNRPFNANDKTALNHLY